MSRVLIRSDLLTENNKDILEKYVCPKCDGILRDAVQTSCGHWLCNSCAEEIFDKKETTPYCPRTDCGEELTTEEGRPFFPDRFVRKEINRFSIMCPNRKFGCDWSGKIGELFEHLSSCVYEKEECPHCKEGFSLSEYQSHVNQCPKMTVTCPLKDHGCKETEMSREECIEHVSSKTGIYYHFLMIADIFSSIVPSSSSDAQEGERRNVVESDGGYESMSKVRSASPKAIKRYVSTDGPEPRGNEFGFLEDGVAGAVGGYGEIGGGRLDDKLMSLVMTKITGIQAELTKKDSQIHTLQDKYQSHVDQCPKMTVTCPLKDHGCKETEEMSREECIEHVASKEGICSHLLIIANKSLSIRILLTSSIDAKEEDRRNYVESDGGYESLPKVRSASPKAIVSTGGPDPRGSDLGFLEDKGRLENEFYCTLSAKEKALGPSQYYDEEQGQGHGRDDLTVTDLSPAGSLTVTLCPCCYSNILSSEPDNHKCIVTCPLKDHGCKETKEMSLEECIEHLSSKTGFYSHFLMIARFLSSIVPTGSTEAQEREGGNYGEGDEGYDSLCQPLSTSQTVARKPDGPDPGGNESGFLEDGGAGADDEPMSLTTTLRA